MTYLAVPNLILINQSYIKVPRIEGRKYAP